jgi:hypothetical protein
MWIGLVDYEVRYADGREDVFHAKDQYVPAYALPPRKYGA